MPAEFFVHRHVYGKWACRCCETQQQELAAPEVIDGGIAASGLLAHTLISRFVDQLPYYLQETINARSGVHTPLSTLAAWAGQVGTALEPLDISVAAELINTASDVRELPAMVAVIKNTLGAYPEQTLADAAAEIERLQPLARVAVMECAAAAR